VQGIIDIDRDDLYDGVYMTSDVTISLEPI
jgi:hypothetical protein